MHIIQLYYVHPKKYHSKVVKESIRNVLNDIYIFKEYHHKEIHVIKWNII